MTIEKNLSMNLYYGGYEMNVNIRRLTPALLNDYLHFFETDAHSDNPNEDRCYCVGWCNADHHIDMGFSSPEKRRETAIQYINNGLIQGYLAYIDEKAVGWCNTNTKSDCMNCDGWLRFKTAVETTESDSKVKSIYCFTIAPEMKRKGIAAKLLECVCNDAADDGFEYVEAYPEQRFVDTFSAMGGPLELYKRNGFTICQEVNDKYKGKYDLKYYVVRKPLKQKIYQNKR